MKQFVKKLAILAIPALMMSACNKKQAVSPAASPANPTSSVNQNSGARSEGKTTLSYFQAEAQTYNYTVRLAPATYVPAKAGVWNYDKVYLYDQHIGRVFELYTFTNTDALNFAMASNEKDLWEDQGVIYCSGKGGTCGDTSGGVPCVAMSSL